MQSLHRLRSLSALVLLALLVLSLDSTLGVKGVQAACKVKTKAPSIVPVPAPGGDSIGGDAIPTTTPKTTKPPTLKPATPKPTPSSVQPTPTTKAPSPTTVKPVTTPRPTANNATTTAPSGGKCVTGDPTQYITKADVDWIWEKRMKPHFNFKNFIFDQLMASNGKLSYCIRWDSTNKLPKATASKFQAMLQYQYDQWNKWLVGYGCWPFEKIELEMVGVSVRDKNLLDWSDDSLGPIYEKELDGDGIPRCPEACYKHRNFEAKSDTSACKGKPFDISLWPTKGMGGGAGGDWGQRADEGSVLGSLNGGASTIVSHEIGHGFGLPDFYEPQDRPHNNLPKLIMVAGASRDVTEGDGWILRRAWEHVRMRYPATSG